MTALVDTSSFAILARYYLPFDKSGGLMQLVENKYESGEILLLDAVFDECRYQAGGLIISTMPCLDDKARIISTKDLVPTRRFLNMLENQFCDQSVRSVRNITDPQFEVEKAAYLESGDGRLLLYSALANDPDLMIVTEETAVSNDNKLFKKIPACARELGIDCITLPQFIQRSFEPDLGELLVGQPTQVVS